MGRRIKIYFSPVHANPIIVPKLKKILGSRFKFVALSSDDNRRHEELREIGAKGERCIYLWGDGHHHHDSYYFTVESAMIAKLNTDQHQDLRDSLDLERGGAGEISFGNHMFHVLNDGIFMITEIRSGEIIRKVLEHLRKRQLRDLMHTIDCDVLINFPSGHLDWIQEEVELDADLSEKLLTTREVEGFVGELGDSVHSMDLGGMGRILDFEFNEIGDFIPDVEVVRRVVYESNRRPRRRVPGLELDLTQAMVDQVGSYGLSAYVRIIREFAKTF